MISLHSHASFTFVKIRNLISIKFKPISIIFSLQMDIILWHHRKNENFEFELTFSCLIFEVNIIMNSYSEFYRQMYEHIHVLWVIFVHFSVKYTIKVGCVFPTGVVSMLPQREFGPNGHREHAPHFRWVICLATNAQYDISDII